MSRGPLEEPFSAHEGGISPRCAVALALGVGLAIGAWGGFALFSSGEGWMAGHVRAERSMPPDSPSTSPSRGAPAHPKRRARPRSVADLQGDLRAAIDDAVSSLGPTPEVDTLSSLLEELERDARSAGEVRAVHVEPGLSAIDAASSHIGYAEAERLRGSFLATMGRLASGGNEAVR